MRRQLIISSVVFSLLAGCASVRQSKINPLNWFGPSETVHSEAQQPQSPRVVELQTLAPRKGYVDFVDTRPLVPRISELTISKTSTGAIITATGHVPALGYFDAQLVPAAEQQSGALSFDFRIRTPKSHVGVGSAKQQTIIAAYVLSNQDLENLSSVTVLAANGARTTRR